MCFIVFAVAQHAEFPLIVCANRDEFLDRPTKVAEFWKPVDSSIEILAGQDIRAGGTWMGISREGRFAAVTNIRGISHQSSAPSRGELPLRFLCAQQSIEDWARSFQTEIRRYNGCNLLIGEGSDVWWLSSQSSEPIPIGPGIHGLSNASLNTPWPKVIEGKRRLAHILESEDTPDPQRLTSEVLTEPHLVVDDQLPDTGVGIEWERRLATIFIPKSENYGTRSSTIYLKKKGDGAIFHETTWPENTKLSWEF